jgi:hypothetical protein
LLAKNIGTAMPQPSANEDVVLKFRLCYHDPGGLEMLSLALSSPLAAALLLLPAAVFAGLGLMSDAPGEWGQGTLLAWTSLAAALLAGAGLAEAGALWCWAALALAFLATAVGGPPGLLLVAVALLLLLPQGAVPAPRWLPLALAAPPVLVSLRYYLVG